MPIDAQQTCIGQVSLASSVMTPTTKDLLMATNVNMDTHLQQREASLANCLAVFLVSRAFIFVRQFVI